jgi:rubrerythrin
MGFLSKVKNRTESKAADKIADGIVNAVFKKKKKDDDNEVRTAPKKSEPEPQPQAQPQPQPQVDQEAIRAQATANAMNSEQMQMAMGAMYNTKRCPECQAVCVNSPAACPYCGADLKGVKPMTPEELEALSD